MAALPSAFDIQGSHAWRIAPPRPWTPTSTRVVVPPNAAAIVPDSKSSAEVVPPNGMSRWVCTSMPPGMTYLPPASMPVSPGAAFRSTPTAAIFSPSIRTSPLYRSVAVTTVPFLISVAISDLHHLPVGLRPAIAEELPGPADLLDHPHVHRAADQ